MTSAELAAELARMKADYDQRHGSSAPNSRVHTEDAQFHQDHKARRTIGKPLCGPETANITKAGSVEPSVFPCSCDVLPTHEPAQYIASNAKDDSRDIPQDSAWQPEPGKPVRILNGDGMYRAAVEAGYVSLKDYVANSPAAPPFRAGDPGLVIAYHATSPVEGGE